MPTSNSFTSLFKRALVALMALAIALTAVGDVAWSQSAKRRNQKQGQNAGPNIIRDAEIEGLLRQYTKPIFQQAGINPGSVTVFIIADDSINAFVAGGQRIYVNTGIFTKTSNAREVIGVLAHETGHIAGGHLARLRNELARANIERIIGTLAGAAAMVGGAAAGSSQAAKAGQGIMLGTQGMAQRNLLSYQRSMEAAADQAGLKYLFATKQDPSGMLSLFQKLANESLAATTNADPYMFSHPMPLDRIRNLEIEARKSPYFDSPPNPAQDLRYELVKAKLNGFMLSPQRVFQRYPMTDTSMQARYARAIAMFRQGDIQNSLPLIDELTSELPQNPYFWELKAQALLENGQAEAGIPSIRTARKLLPNNGLMQILNADLLLGTEKAAYADEAVKLLTLAKKTESATPAVYKSLARAYGLKGDVPRAELATAEYAWLTGDRELAVEKARAATQYFKQGSKEWTRASDLVALAEKAKKG